MGQATLVVYDCMVFLQAVSSPAGPAFRCLESIEAGAARLLICPAIVTELYDVLNRPHLRTRLRRLTPQSVSDFLERVLQIADHRPDPTRHFALPRDPDDEIYLNLAIESEATHLVTWNDRHLTYLMRSTSPEAIDFRVRFPSLMLLDPPSFLKLIAPAAPPNPGP